MDEPQIGDRVSVPISHTLSHSFSLSPRDVWDCAAALWNVKKDFISF